MDSQRKPDPDGTSPAPGGDVREQPGYEPPAIAWEEIFEPIAATTCAQHPLQGPPCGQIGTS